MSHGMGAAGAPAGARPANTAAGGVDLRAGASWVMRRNTASAMSAQAAARTMDAARPLSARPPAMALSSACIQPGSPGPIPDTRSFRAPGVVFAGSRRYQAKVTQRTAHSSRAATGCSGERSATDSSGSSLAESPLPGGHNKTARIVYRMTAPGRPMIGLTHSQTGRRIPHQTTRPGRPTQSRRRGRA